MRPRSRHLPRDSRTCADVSSYSRSINSRKAGTRSPGGAERAAAGCTCSGTHASTGWVKLAIIQQENLRNEQRLAHRDREQTNTTIGDARLALARCGRRCLSLGGVLTASEGLELLHSVRTACQLYSTERISLLELVVSTLLPVAADLDTYLDAAIHLLRAALVVDAELENVAILEQLRTTLHIGAGQSDVIEEGS